MEKHRARVIARAVAIVVAAASPARAVPDPDQPHNALPASYLSEAAMLADAPLRAWLASHPLDTIEAFAAQSSVDADQVQAAMPLLEYVVSCALPRGREVKVGSTRLAGELGLSPEWQKAPPDLRSRQLVSSCVLARVNARHKRVSLSMRALKPPDGKYPRLWQMHKQVSVERQYRELQPDGSTIDIASVTKACAPNSDLKADCGWTPLYVGRCQATTSGPPPPTTLTVTSGPGTPLKVRVCNGLYGCDYACDPAATPARCKYVGRLADSSASSFTFPCRANGPSVKESDGKDHRYGYYSVLVAPAAAGPFNTDAVHVVASPADQWVHYPANEEEVFTYREGAFFGDLFGGDFNYRCSPGGRPFGNRMLGGDLHACYAFMMTDYVAMMTGRWCANPPTASDPCFINDPKPCPSGHPPMCTHQGSVLDLVFTSCSEGGAWKFPITTYLSGPCDLSTDECVPEKWPTIGNQ